jgi:hypothetical protein
MVLNESEANRQKWTVIEVEGSIARVVVIRTTKQAGLSSLYSSRKVKTGYNNYESRQMDQENSNKAENRSLGMLLIVKVVAT